ncbi:MAG: hypothetical protein ACLTHQ_03380, partial [Odoribacter splanchnicus]
RVLGDWNTPFLSMLKLEQLAYGEGGNTGGEGGSVNDCDIFLYNRNYAEATERVKITFNIKLQGYIEFAGKKYTLSPGVSVDRDVLIPICEKSEGNCCKKSWLDSSIRYL